MKNNRNYTLPIILVTVIVLFMVIRLWSARGAKQTFLKNIKCYKAAVHIAPGGFFHAYFLVALPGVFTQKVELLSGYYCMARAIFFRDETLCRFTIRCGEIHA